ncbi:MAG: hypothetical protein AAGE52_30575 [Myxococcota bacterium]
MALEVRLLGIPVRIHLWFLVTGLILWDFAGGSRLGWGTLPIMLLLVFQGVLFHEMGHALVGRAFGRSPQIVLALFTGVTSFQGGRPFTPGKGIVVSLAGPLVGIVLGLAALPVLMLSPPAEGTAAHWALSMFIFINLGWSLLNLIPVLPLDGGNIMANVLQLISPKHGLRWARYLSLVLIGGLFVLTLLTGEIFAVAFLGLFGFVNVQALRAERAYRASAIAQARTPEELRAIGTKALEEGDGETVSQAAFVLLRVVNDPSERDEALHLLAWGRLLVGEPQQASQALAGLSGQRDPDPALQGAVLFALGRPTDALPYFEQVLVDEPSEFAASRYVEAVENAGAFGTAAVLYERHPRALSPQRWAQLQDGALAAGAFDAALRMSTATFENDATPAAAFGAVRALVRLGRLDDALAWLERARISGFANLELLDGHEDLAALRDSEQWAQARAAFE